MVKFGDSDAIIVNDIGFKNNIIDYIFKTIDLSKYRYNMLESIQQLSYLKTTEHYVSPNYKGFNYILVFTKYNNIPYCAAIDRKQLSYHRNKIDIKLLQIYKIKVIGFSAIFRGTILDCKMIKNIMLIKDCFQLMGNMILDMDHIEKMIYMDNIINEQFQKDYCSNFTFKINTIYRYNMLNEIVKNIIPNSKLLIQGLVFYPKKSGISIVFLDKKIIDTNKVSIIDSGPSIKNESYHMIHDLKNFLVSRNYSYESDGKRKQLIVERTLISDVFNVYDDDEKIGIAHIPNIKTSLYCYENIKTKHLCQCIFNKQFNKWMPLKVISTV
jgi:hypothetical protein